MLKFMKFNISKVAYSVRCRRDPVSQLLLSQLSSFFFLLLIEHEFSALFANNRKITSQVIN